MLARNPHTCPRCGEHVSAFAAGCALCGADLDPKRAQHQGIGLPILSRLPSLPRLRPRTSRARRRRRYS
jgi:predicted amidophosphoribosyltransferase